MSETMDNLGPIDASGRKGAEPFRDSEESLGFDLLSFWQWSSSDLVTNTTRGVLAEYLVARALGAVPPGKVRDVWESYDVELDDGRGVEIKSSAFLQSWHQDRLSQIGFDIRKTLPWDKRRGKYGEGAQRQADVYVFALLAHTDQETLDPMDVSQWEFYVVPTATLDRQFPEQKSIGLSSLRKLTEPLAFRELKDAVNDSASAS